MITKREQEILSYIMENPFISQSEIASKANITRSSVAVHIRNLTTKGYLKGRAYILQNDQYTLCLGNSAIGFYGSVPNICEKESNPGIVDISVDGAARNVAETLLRMGMAVELLTVLGDDEYAQVLRSSLHELGIPYQKSIQAENWKTSVEMTTINREEGIFISVSDASILSLMTPEVLAQRKELLENAKAIYLEDSLPQESLEYLVQNTGAALFVSFRQRGNIKRFLPVLKHIHGLCFSPEQAAFYLGRPIQKYKDVRDAAEQLLEAGVKEAYIAQANGGIYYTNGTSSGRLPNILDRNACWTGLGEAFISGVIRGHLLRYDIKKIALISSLLVKASSLSMYPVNREISDDVFRGWVEQAFTQKILNIE